MNLSGDVDVMLRGVSNISSTLTDINLVDIRQKRSAVMNRPHRAEYLINEG